MFVTKYKLPGSDVAIHIPGIQVFKSVSTDGSDTAEGQTSVIRC